MGIVQWKGEGGKVVILAMEQFRQVGVRGAWVGVWIAF